MTIRFYRKDKTYFDHKVNITEYYCPNCSDKNVFENLECADYYEGSEFLCKSCNFNFTMPTRKIDEEVIWIENNE